jgi:myxalamid-type polyketide synthase MxaE and MxaD
VSNDDQLGQLKRALQTIRDLRAKLGEVEQARAEPVAIIGLGCRFPGEANSPEALWRLLTNGVDAISAVPSARWDNDALFDPDPTVAGTIATRWGGFIDGVDQFDAAFFSISPREATGMDPQQRLLLEVTYEALEDAAQPIERLAGSQTGVFIGAHSHSSDYYWLQANDVEAIDTYTGTGTAHNVLSGRLAYAFNWHGPNVAVDTACSSSLVAVHLAVQSLRAAECRLAIAGGVNVMLTPHFTVAASRMNMLAPDGRCKTFDARADGFVRGEGCGVVVLKRLSDAIADGDPIYAVIRGSAINQDGHTNGLTAPNGLAQQAVIRAALANAQVDAARIAYVETHGTGTPLGDPIEVEALTNVLDQINGQPCWLGALKTNLGHLEGAAGIAGLIKTALVLKHRAIPPNLHYQSLNPHIHFDGTRLAVPTQTVIWPDTDERHCAGVSSFGWSGTNAHVVLEEAPVSAPRSDLAAPDRPYVLPISARDPEALRSLVQAYHDWLTSDRMTSLDDLCFTASVRRSQHADRFVAVGRSREALIEQLAVFAGRGKFVSDKPAGQLPGIAFVFPGQGAQWIGMGRQLLQESPIFRAAMERFDQALRPFVDWSVIDELQAADGHSHLDEIDVIQPVLCAISIALAEVWRAWGVMPEAVIGHSLGEVAAACVAGAIGWEDAARIITTRSRLMKRASGRGAMAVVGLSVAQAQAAINDYADRLSVAVSNSPTSTVLSGDPAALEAVIATLQAQDIFCRRVKVDVAAHSPHMDALREELVTALRDVQPRSAAVSIYSTVTGQTIDGAVLDATYWGRNLREPVLFATAVEQAIAAGVTTFIELSPHPILTQAIEQTAQANLVVLPSLRREADEQAALLTSLGDLYVAGYAVDWRKVYPQGQVVALPPYPWQRERFWFETSHAQQGVVGGQKAAHPLLGWQIDVADRASRVWQVELDRRRLPQLGAHRLNGAALLAASASLEMMWAAARAAFIDQPMLIADLYFQRALVLSEEPARVTAQITLTTGPTGDVVVGLYSRQGEVWQLHVTGKVQLALQAQAQPESVAAIQVRCAASLSSSECYRALEDKGVQIGAALRSIAHVWRGERELLAQLSPAEKQNYSVAPSLLDAGFQLLGLMTNDLAMPVQAAQARLASEASSTWVHAQLRTADHGEPIVDLRWLDEAGNLVIEVTGLRLKPVEQRGVSDNPADWLYELGWRVSERQPNAKHSTATGSWIVLTDRSGVGAALAELIAQQGGQCALIEADDDWAQAFDRAWAAAPTCEGVVDLRSLDMPAFESLALDSLEAAQVSSCGAAVQLVQTMARREWREPPRLWLITRGAQAIDRAVNPAPSALWGLGRVVAVEHHELWGGLIDLDPAEPAIESVAQLVDELLNPQTDQLAFRAGRRYAAQLERMTPAASAIDPLHFRPDAAYLITGGLGGIGQHIARWLIARGARHLILMGRTPLPPRATWRDLQVDRLMRLTRAIQELEALGASVHYAAVDVSDEAQLAAFLEMYHRESRPAIRGVVHAAGVIEDRMLLQLDDATLRTVLRPKVIGSWLLHQHLRDQPLDFFVLFSSVGALLGQPGQGNYAAANAFLDTLAHYRHSQGLPALSINWGAWDGLGFAITSGGRRVIQHLADQGIGGFSVEQGLQVLELLLHAGTVQAAVLPIDWQQFRAAGTQLALLADLAKEQNIETAPVARSVRDTLVALNAEARRAVMEDHLRSILAHILRLAPARIQAQTPLGALGLDSLVAVEFRNRLEISLGLRLSATLAWNYPTVRDLATHLLGKLDPPGEPAASPVHIDEPARTAAAPEAHVIEQVQALSDEEALRALRNRRK